MSDIMSTPGSMDMSDIMSMPGSMNMSLLDQYCLSSDSEIITIHISNTIHMYSGITIGIVLDGELHIRNIYTIHCVLEVV